MNNEYKVNANEENNVLQKTTKINIFSVVSKTTISKFEIKQIDFNIIQMVKLIRAQGECLGIGSR